MFARGVQAAHVLPGYRSSGTGERGADQDMRRIYLWALQQRWGGSGAGWATGTLAMIAGLCSSIGGLVADRLGRVRTMRGAALVMVLSGVVSAVVVSLAAAPTVASLVLIVPFFAMLGLGSPAQMTLATELYPGAKGSAMGIYNLVRFGVGALGPLVLPAALAASPASAMWMGTLGAVVLWFLSYLLSEPTEVPPEITAQA